MRIDDDIAAKHGVPNDASLDELVLTHQNIAYRLAKLYKLKTTGLIASRRLALRRRLESHGINAWVAASVLASISFSMLVALITVLCVMQRWVLLPAEIVCVLAVGATLASVTWGVALARLGVRTHEIVRRGAPVVERLQRVKSFLEFIELKLPALESHLGRVRQRRIAFESAYFEQSSRNAQISTRIQLLNVEFNQLSGHEFEHYVAGVYRLNGYEARVTPGSGDQGADLIVQKEEKSTCVQTKLYQSPVGNKAVQEAYSGQAYYKCDDSAVVTNNRFTRSAHTLAERVGCQLIDGEKLREMIVGDYSDLICRVRGHISQNMGPTPDAHIDQVPSNGPLVPGEVLKQITAYAKECYRGDRVEQQECIDDQTEAYHKLQQVCASAVVPPNVLNSICSDAEELDPGDYLAQLEGVESQLAGQRPNSSVKVPE